MNVKYSKIRIPPYPSAALPAHVRRTSNKKQTLCAKWTSKWNKSNNLNKLWCSPTRALCQCWCCCFSDSAIRGNHSSCQEWSLHSQHLIVAAYYVLNQMVYISLSPYSISACFIWLHRSAVFFAFAYHSRNIFSQPHRIAKWIVNPNGTRRSILVECSAAEQNYISGTSQLDNRA